MTGSIRKSQDEIETSALWYGVFVNLLMAVAGWIAFYLTESQALLLDGNFSFIASISTLGAILIVKKKHTRTKIFPYGRYFYESFFTLFKGLMILGLTITALFQNVIKILDFIDGAQLTRLKTGPILGYIALMLILCFGLAYVFTKKNKLLDGGSPILSVEAKSASIDGFMTIAVGIALILSTLVPDDSALSFLLYIGDAIIVVILCLILSKIPIVVIRDAFVELGGGAVQNNELNNEIHQMVTATEIPGLILDQIHISKTGSGHLVIVYVVGSENITIKNINDLREFLFEKVSKKLSNLELEVIPRSSS